MYLYLYKKSAIYLNYPRYGFFCFSRMVSNCHR